ncbi:MAG: 4Fe-4S binding protein [Christensenellales bacterium]|jgi:NAD-dependent dihydropyrimidine dehydrogenase PreA subunit
MSVAKAKRRRAEIDRASCVACGCCVKVCSLRAIEVYRGICAQIDEDRCVGCGKCVRECPAGVIAIAGVYV